MKLITCHSVDFDSELTPHFLRYYIKLGVPLEDFIFILNCIKDEDKLEQVLAICNNFGIKPEIWRGEYDSKTMHGHRMRLLNRRCNPGEWIIHADADELHEYPTPLNEALEGDFNCIQGVFIDRIAPDGEIKDVTPTPSLDDQFPIKANAIPIQFRRKDATTGTVKMMAYRHGLEPRKGGHQIEISRIGPIKYAIGYNLADHKRILQSEFRWNCHYKVHHFRWTSTLVPKLTRRVGVYKRLGVKTWGTAQGQVDYILKNNKINLEQIDIFT